MIEATPHPGYQPRSPEARFLTKARGKLWIDEQDHLAARVEAEFIDDVNFGAFLAKLHKGSRFRYNQVPVNSEVWAAQPCGGQLLDADSARPPARDPGGGIQRLPQVPGRIPPPLNRAVDGNPKAVTHVG